jgi:glycosyltransferase involved in cell wall biosynthesis
MKILFMANVAPNPNTGASGTEFQTARALRALGHTVDNVWTDDLSHNLRHFNLYNLVELPFAYRRALEKKLQTKRYDVVHVNQPHGYLAAKRVRALHNKTIFIHRSHGLESRVKYQVGHWKSHYGEDSRPVWRRMSSHLVDASFELSNLAIARYAHGHVVSASECRDFLHSRYNVPLNQIAVIPQAPPEEYRTIEPKPMTEQRLRRVLYVGQFAFIKAPMVLARAVERILTTLPEARMTWVCDKQHHEQAKKLIRARTVRQRVSFLEWQDQLDLMRIYDDHGVFLFPSFFEGFGKAWLEAMSRGLVVIAASNGGMRDVISHGRSGLLTSTGDWQTMADCAVQAIESPNWSAGISMEARKVSLNYSWQRVATEISSFYTSLIERHASRVLAA